MSFTSIYFNKKPQTYVEIGYCLFPTKKLSIHKMPFMKIQFYFSFFIVLVVIFSNLEKLGFGLPAQTPFPIVPRCHITTNERTRERQLGEKPTGCVERRTEKREIFSPLLTWSFSPQQSSWTDEEESAEMAKTQEVERIAKKLDKMVHKKNTVRAQSSCCIRGMRAAIKWWVYL